MIYSSNIFPTVHKKITAILLLFLLSSSFYNVYSQQCGFNAAAGDGCPNTDYNNFGLYSNNNPATIEYDNMVSAFHASIVRNANGSFSVWGATMANDGVGDVLSPQEVNSTNYPALGSHKVLKATVASDGSQQTILLTSDGLYTWGTVGLAFNSTLKPTAAFGRVGNTNGSSTSNLPPGVTPADVKMLTASNLNSTTGGNIILTTCSGEVWALAIAPSVRGDGTSPAIANNLSWSQVMKSAGVPLTNIVAARINRSTVIALDSNNTLWTWGVSALLGNGTASATLSYATQMTHPDATKTIKMIGATAWGGGGASISPSYYVLMTDGNLYSLGNNSMKQLGDFTTTQRTSWVQPRYTGTTGPVMNNIKWISPNENDGTYSTINVITNDGQLYAWGDNHTGMLGLTTSTSGVYPAQPSGLLVTDKIIAVESGGHTSMIIKECATNFGYVGHRVSGSMGNGSAANGQANAYSFVTAAVNICGTGSITTTTVPNSGESYCIGTPIQLTASPAGGTWSIASGSATITTSGLVTSTGVGAVVVNYTFPATCTPNTMNYTLNMVACCNAGTTAPTLASTPQANVCPDTTVNLTTITASNLPASTTLTWHTGTPATTANKILGSAVTAGTYYAAFFDAVSDCYSPTTEVTPTVVSCVAAGTIDCSKTQITTIPVLGEIGQKSLVVTINVTQVGCFTPLSVSGSGMSLANAASSVCTTTTGIQQFVIPTNYDGTALGTMTFTVGSAGSCSADLTSLAGKKKVITDVWTLENCSLIQVGPSLK